MFLLNCGKFLKKNMNFLYPNGCFVLWLLENSLDNSYKLHNRTYLKGRGYLPELFRQIRTYLPEPHQ